MASSQNFLISRGRKPDNLLKALLNCKRFICLKSALISSALPWVITCWMYISNKAGFDKSSFTPSLKYQNNLFPGVICIIFSLFRIIMIDEDDYSMARIPCQIKSTAINGRGLKKLFREISALILAACLWIPARLKYLSKPGLWASRYLLLILKYLRYRK